MLLIEIKKLYFFIKHFSVAGSSSTIYAYLGEFNTLKNRAAVIAWASIFVALANIYIPGKLCDKTQFRLYATFGIII